MSRPSSEEIRYALEKIVSSSRVSDKRIDRIAYCRDQYPRSLMRLRQGKHEPLPDFIVWPGSPEEVATILAYCAEHQIPVYAVGGGTSSTGASAPSSKGIVLDLKRLDRVRWIHKEDGLAEVETGILGIQLEERLQREELTLGHFPTSIAASTLGGWVATRSAGQASSRYGKIEDLVVELEIATAHGVVHWCRDIYDFSPLILGNEGTLAVVTACRLKVYPAPQARRYHALLFSSLEDGIETMRRLLQETTPPPTVLRLYDPIDSLISPHHKTLFTPDPPSDLPSLLGKKTERAITPYYGRSGRIDDVQKVIGKVFRQARRTIFAALLEHAKISHALLENFLAKHSLMIIGYEEDSPEECQRLMEKALSICQDKAEKDLGESPGLHWFHHRYEISFKQSKLFRAGSFTDMMDVATTWGEVLPLYNKMKAVIKQDAMVMADFSHPYQEGCAIRFAFAAHPSSKEEFLRYDRVWRKAMSVAASSGATLSHHQGIGVKKASGMPIEIGEAGIRMFELLRDSFGATGALNPGKLVIPSTNR